MKQGSSSIIFFWELIRNKKISIRGHCEKSPYTSLRKHLEKIIPMVGQSLKPQVSHLRQKGHLFLHWNLMTRKGEIRRKGWLPWWLRGKESACQCRGHRFDPWSRKIPRPACASQLPSPRTTTTGAWAHLASVPCNKRNHGNERTSITTRE